MARCVLLVLCCGLVSIACGGSTSANGSGANTAGTGSGNGGTATGGTPSGGTAAGGTPSGGTATGGTPSGGTAAGGASSSASYAACYVIGAYNRLHIAQYDAALPLCVHLVVTQPSSGPGSDFQVSTPPGYVVERANAAAVTSAGDCTPFATPSGSVPASAASGSIQFMHGSGLPIIGLGFDVTVTFPSGQGVPTSARLRAENLGVGVGCN